MQLLTGTELGNKKEKEIEKDNNRNIKDVEKEIKKEINKTPQHINFEWLMESFGALVLVSARLMGGIRVFLSDGWDQGPIICGWD